MKIAIQPQEKAENTKVNLEINLTELYVIWNALDYTMNGALQHTEASVFTMTGMPWAQVTNALLSVFDSLGDVAVNHHKDPLQAAAAITTVSGVKKRLEVISNAYSPYLRLGPDGNILLS